MDRLENGMLAYRPSDDGLKRCECGKLIRIDDECGRCNQELEYECDNDQNIE